MVGSLRLLGLWVLGALVSLLCWWRISLLGDLRLRLWVFSGWFAAAFLLYLAALWLIRRTEQRPSSARFTWLGAGIIFLGAAAFRLMLLPTTPTLSDDIYRYRWDGRVQRAGIDPYAYAPSDPSLAFLRDEQSSHINFPNLRTVYPPMTQVAFRLGASLGETLTVQKAVFVAAELLTVLGLLIVLRRRGRSPLWVAAYAWHPLVILEIAGQGHNDALGIAFLWLGLAAWEAGRVGRSAVSWALAFLSKYATAILIPWWWFRRVAHRWLAVFLLLAVWPIVCCPTIVTALSEGLSTMTARFESNSSVFWLVAWLTGHAGSARMLVIGGWVAFLVWWARREADPARYLFGAMIVAAVLSPVLHPWYVTWLVPFFALWRVPALIVLSGSVVLAYTVWPGYLAEGRWALPVWAHILEYAPVFLLGLWELLRAVARIRSAGRFPARFASLCEAKRSCGVAAPHARVANARRPQQPGATRIGVIIPARNEADAIGSVLAEMPRELVHDVVVVDNGSTDATADVARAHGARVVAEPTPGYGRACLAGLAALGPSIDIVVFMDGDHSDYPEDLAKLLEPIRQDRADLVIGSRVTQAEPGSLTIQQRLGNRLACALMRLCFGARYTDLGPFRAIRREALERLAMRDLAFGWTVEMQAKAARARLRILEVPVRYRRRIGRSKISGTLAGTLRAGRAILSTIVRVARRPA